eukprot:Awhi_evm1s555
MGNVITQECVLKSHADPGYSVFCENAVSEQACYDTQVCNWVGIRKESGCLLKPELPLTYGRLCDAAVSEDQCVNLYCQWLPELFDQSTLEEVAEVLSTLPPVHHCAVRPGQEPYKRYCNLQIDDEQGCQDFAPFCEWKRSAGDWSLAGNEQTCGDYCSSLGKTCNGDALNSIDTEQEMRFLTRSVLGRNCRSYAADSYGDEPYIYLSDDSNEEVTNCAFAGDYEADDGFGGEISFGSRSPENACNAVAEDDYIRFCCCGPDCPTTY